MVTTTGSRLGYAGSIADPRRSILGRQQEVAMRPVLTDYGVDFTGEGYPFSDIKSRSPLDRAATSHFPGKGSNPRFAFSSFSSHVENLPQQNESVKTAV